MIFTVNPTLNPAVTLVGNYDLGEADLMAVIGLVFEPGHEDAKDLLLKLFLFRGVPFVTEAERAQAVADVFKLVDDAKKAAALPKP
jgi:hypothetical protein